MLSLVKNTLFISFMFYIGSMIAFSSPYEFSRNDSKDIPHEIAHVDR